MVVVTCLVQVMVKSSRGEHPKTDHSVILFWALARSNYLAMILWSTAKRIKMYSTTLSNYHAEGRRLVVVKTQRFADLPCFRNGLAFPGIRLRRLNIYCVLVYFPIPTNQTIQQKVTKHGVSDGYWWLSGWLELGNTPGHWVILRQIRPAPANIDILSRFQGSWWRGVPRGSSTAGPDSWAKVEPEGLGSDRVDEYRLYFATAQLVPGGRLGPGACGLKHIRGTGLNICRSY